MKKTKFMSMLALTAVVVSTTAVPVYAANNATAGTEVTYTANSAAPDAAVWLVAYPKKIVLTDYNNSSANGAALKFELKDKLTSNPYNGDRTVTVAVQGYAPGGILMDKAGTGGDVRMGIAATAGGAEVSDPYTIGTMKKVNGGTENISTGYAYLNLPAAGNKAEGTYSKTVTFSFTDDAPAI